jgi:hypothetical protein
MRPVKYWASSGWVWLWSTDVLSKLKHRNRIRLWSTDVLSKLKHRSRMDEWSEQRSEKCNRTGESIPIDHDWLMNTMIDWASDQCYHMVLTKPLTDDRRWPNGHLQWLEWIKLIDCWYMMTRLEWLAACALFYLAEKALSHLKSRTRSSQLIDQ